VLFVKRSLIVLLALLCAASFVFAADKSSSALTPWVDKGELLANAGIGWGGLSGGAEFTLARINIGEVIPLTFGAAARAMVDPGIFNTSYSSFQFGLGAFGTAHFGFKSLNLPDGLTWLSRFDAYAGLGLGFGSATLADAYSSSYYTFKPGIGISTFEGTSYYLNDKLAIGFEYGYLGRVGYTYDLGFGVTGSYYWPLYYSNIGVILKL
jgi:hypothetical protein